jgi:hypothetical protein
MKKLCLIFLALTFIGAAPVDETEKLYLDLETYYLKWNDGLFGSTSVYRLLINELLMKSYKKDIKTGYNFVLIYPEVTERDHYTCRFYFGGWLTLIGEIKPDDLKKVVASEGTRYKKEWNSAKLVSFSGKIRKYWLSNSPGKECIVLYLDNISLEIYNPKNP